jgi:hypothetical protein
MAVIDEIKRLTERLFPTGRAFKIPKDGKLDRLIDALKVYETKAVNDATSILDSILPDNDNFTAEDASQWEVRLGLPVNNLIPLADRKLAIKRKMNHPGLIPARQHARYIEGQLQAAGFNVWVHENIPVVNPVTFGATPLDGLGELNTYQLGGGELGSAEDFISNTILSQVQLGQFQLGSSQLGFTFNNMVVNHTDPDLDLDFDPDGFNCSFYIGGEIYGTFADVLSSRETEFRQLILKLKPANTVAFIYVNYI